MAANRFLRVRGRPGRWREDLVRPCGTEAAYKRHIRRGEVPGEDCRAEANRMAALRKTPAWRAGSQEERERLSRPPGTAGEAA